MLLFHNILTENCQEGGGGKKFFLGHVYAKLRGVGSVHQPTTVWFELPKCNYTKASALKPKWTNQIDISKMLFVIRLF